MEKIYIYNKEEIKVRLMVGRNYNIIYRKDGIQYEASGVIIAITDDVIVLEYTTIEISKIEDITDITIE
ncbi:hypothetical protein [Clostridium sp. JNZ J1-5]